MAEPSDRAIVREATELCAPVAPLGVPVPAYGGRSLPNVVGSALRALGAEASGVPELLPPLVDALDPFRGRRAEGPVVVLLIDGLGWTGVGGLSSALDAAPTEWRSRARPITSVFPTTTTVALTSVSTVEPPSRHGVVGHRVFLPSFGSIVELLRMSPPGVGPAGSLVGSEWEPSLVSGVPTVFRRGVAGQALTRERFLPEGFTRMIYDGANVAGYSTAADFAHILGSLLQRPEPPSFVLAYWDELDTVQHLRGPRPEFARFEVGQVARILESAGRGLAPARARSTTVLVTSDHGQVPTERGAEIAIDREPTILPHLARPPTGDRRAAFFAARPGHTEALSEALGARLPPGHRILPIPRAVDAGLFGPPPFHPELTARLGDLLVLVPSPAAVTYRVPGSPPRPRHLPGAHGGLEAAELLVPLIAGSLAELGARAPDG